MTFPRDKVCGDFVGPSALVELDSLGISRMDGYARTNIARRAALYIDGEELISRPFPEIEGMPSHGRVIPRLALDNFIADAATRRFPGDGGVRSRVSKPAATRSVEAAS
jgi:hypothetical protein